MVHHRRRQGKLVTGGHTTMIEGLKDFVERLARWDEIESIRIGRITTHRRAGRSNRKLRTTLARPESHPDLQPAAGGVWHGELFAPTTHRRPQMGGGFRFRVTGWAKVGEIIVGIRCSAVNGRSIQDVVLTAQKDLGTLKSRLVEAGLCEDF